MFRCFPGISGIYSDVFLNISPFVKPHARDSCLVSLLKSLYAKFTNSSDCAFF